MMFELIEAVRGRLIGPKTWDRIIGNYFSSSGQSVTIHLFSWVIYGAICAINDVLTCIRSGMAMNFGFTK